MKVTRLFSILAIAVMMLACQNTKKSADIPTLRFHDGTLRIAQFTDIHWAHNETEANNEKKVMILEVIKMENPDVCILTGDIVTDEPGMEGLEEIINVFETAGKPFAYVCGNHDVECMDPDSLFDRLALSSLFIGEKGPEDLHGVGNYVVPVRAGNSEETAALLYCINSGNHSDNREDSDYDWIRPEQTAWYCQQSNAFNIHSSTGKLPALAFFHICLPEYITMREGGNYEGSFSEDECPGDINGGFFGAAYEQGDIMGFFVGHDHSNDYVGMHKGLMLAYGRQSGVALNEDENTPMGARIIEIHEGKREFETWITTPKGREWTYYYPMGISSLDETTMPLLKAIEVDSTEQGVNFAYYEGPIHQTSEICALGEKIEEGRMDSITINNAKVEDHFAYLFRAFIDIPETGIYRFKLYNDDGAVLRIDGTKVVDNDGGHSAKLEIGAANLEKGLHQFELDYFENYMGQTLEIGIASRFMPQQPLPAKMLRIKKK